MVTELVLSFLPYIFPVPASLEWDKSLFESLSVKREQLKRAYKRLLVPLVLNSGVSELLIISGSIYCDTD